MNLFQKYSTPEGWQEDIELYEKRLNLIKEEIDYWKKEKDKKFQFKKRKERIEKNLKTFNYLYKKTIDNLEYAKLNKKKYEDKEKKEES